MKKVAIIGAGASGILASINLKKQFNNNIDVYLIEKNNRIGKKIITSGNGKCNITNETHLENNIYNNCFADNIYRNFSPITLREYFQSLGIFTKTDNMNRVYPLTESSSTVLDILLMHLRKENVKIYTDTLVNKIISNNYKYILNTSSEEINKIQFDDIIISIGSIASIKNTNINNHYKLLKDLDINITNIIPGLVGLKIKKNQINGFSGIRQKAKVTLFNNEKIVFEELGEVQFKDDGISGIVVMNASSIIARSKNKLNITLDLLPTYNIEELVEQLNIIQKQTNITLSDLVHGILPKMISNKLCSILEKKSILNIYEFIKLAKNYQLEIEGTYGFEFGQVCVGGVDLSEITDDFELKKYPNVYVIGEVLNIDGLCGGYNLQFAFSSGYLVSNAIYKKEGL